jgi:hypothetical protein
MFKSIVARFLGMSGAVLAFFTPVLRKLAISGLESLLGVAQFIVSDLEDRDDLTGAQKRDRAVAMLTEEAQHQGIAASSALINFAVEAALQRLRS